MCIRVAQSLCLMTSKSNISPQTRGIFLWSSGLDVGLSRGRPEFESRALHWCRDPDRVSPWEEVKRGVSVAEWLRASKA